MRDQKMKQAVRYRLILRESSSFLYLENLRSPEGVYEFAKERMELHLEPEEVLVVVGLDSKGGITGVFEVNRGTLNASICHPREIFKRVIQANSDSFIMFHNHPSGDPTPSQNDIEMTKIIKQAGELLAVPIRDHLVVGSKRYFSFREKGII